MPRFLSHLLFWLVVLLWTNVIYLQKEDFGQIYFIFNLVRLPLMMLATYTVSHFMLPRLLTEQWSQKRFGIHFGLFFICIVLLDRLLIGTTFIEELFAETGLVYHFFNEIPLLRNAYIMLSVITTASLWRFYQFYRTDKSGMQAQLAPVANFPKIDLRPIPSTNPPTEKLFLKSGNTTHCIDPATVLFLKKDENYVIYHTEDQRILVRQSLQAAVDELDGRMVRVHRSYAVGRAHIRAMGKQEIMVGKWKIPLGRSYKERLDIDA